MSEEQQSAPETPEFDPITSQEEFDKRVEGRLKQQERKFSDYQDLKAKAARLDKIEAAAAEANKSWEERFNTLQSTVVAKDLEILRVQVAAEKGVPANRISGSTREELESDADELLSLLKTEKPKPSTALKSGATGVDTRLDPRERAAAALRQYRKT